jgi:ankyrin repeat protein
MKPTKLSSTSVPSNSAFEITISSPGSTSLKKLDTAAATQSFILPPSTLLKARKSHSHYTNEEEAIKVLQKSIQTLRAIDEKIRNIPLSDSKRINELKYELAIKTSSHQKLATELLYHSIGELWVNLSTLAIRSGADINHRVKSGDSLLSYAIIKGRTLIVLSIIETGRADYQITDKTPLGFTALHHAAYQNDGLTLRELITSGKMNPNSLNAKGDTPLHIAAAKGNAKAVDTLLMSEGILVNIKDIDGNIPLHLAVKQGEESIVRQLLEKGANPNELNKNGFTPLHQSTRSDNPNVIQLLLDYQADPNLSRGGWTPLGIAVLVNKIENAKILIQSATDEILYTPIDEKGTTLIHLAAKKGHLEILNLLIKHGCNLNIMDYNQNTTLHKAIEGESNPELDSKEKSKQKLHIVKKIIERIKAQSIDGSADLKIFIDFKNKHNQTAIELAKKIKALDIENYLEKEKENYNKELAEQNKQISETFDEAPSAQVEVNETPCEPKNEGKEDVIVIDNSVFISTAEVNSFSSNFAQAAPEVTERPKSSTITHREKSKEGLAKKAKKNKAQLKSAINAASQTAHAFANLNQFTKNISQKYFYKSEALSSIAKPLALEGTRPLRTILQEREGAFIALQQKDFPSEIRLDQAKKAFREVCKLVNNFDRTSDQFEKIDTKLTEDELKVLVEYLLDARTHRKEYKSLSNKIDTKAFLCPLCDNDKSIVFFRPPSEKHKLGHIYQSNLEFQFNAPGSQIRLNMHIDIEFGNGPESYTDKPQKGYEMLPWSFTRFDFKTISEVKKSALDAQE